MNDTCRWNNTYYCPMRYCMFYHRVDDCEPTNETILKDTSLKREQKDVI